MVSAGMPADCKEELGPGWETEIDNPLVPFNSQNSGKCSPLNKSVFKYVIFFLMTGNSPI